MDKQRASKLRCIGRAIIPGTVLILLTMAARPIWLQAERPAAPVVTAPAEHTGVTLTAGWWDFGSHTPQTGGVSQTGGGSYSPAIAIGADGRPIIAWETLSGEIRVRRWDSQDWIDMPFDDQNSVNGSPALAVAPDGNPVVVGIAFDATLSQYRIAVRQWNGAEWTPLPSIPDPGPQGNPQLAVTPAGNLIVVWTDFDRFTLENECEDTDAVTPTQIYVSQWNGTSWGEMGSGSTDGGGISDTALFASEPDIAMGPGGPVIAWAEGVVTCDGFHFFEEQKEIMARRWDGGDWVEIGPGSATGGGISHTPEYSYDPSVAMTDDGRPLVAWTEWERVEDRWSVFIRGWSGAAWDEVGIGSATGGGVSGDGFHYQSSLAVGQDGQPIVAWSGDQTDMDGDAIYVRRFDGTDWLEMNAGSATGDGISWGALYNDGPDLIIAPDGTPNIAWYGGDVDDGIIQFEIQARHYAPNEYTLFMPATTYRYCFPGPLEVEPNHPTRFQGNGPLCAPGVYGGLPQDQDDYFAIDVADGPIDVELAGHAGNGIQLILYREGSNTALIRDADPTGGYRLHYQATAGRYYIRIYAATQNPAATQLYTLTVNYTQP
jgi:hypothetical protein